VLPCFIVAAGSTQGVQQGQPVLGQAGIIGRVAEVWPHRCRVDLLNAPGVAFGALVQSSRALGVVQSRGKHLALDYVAKASPVQIGDLVVTSGVPGLTPQGLPLGMVGSVVKENEGLTLGVEIQPLEDPCVLEVAQIVKAVQPPAGAEAVPGQRKEGGSR
ncbi:MAG TPA: rod shape-determining protein MreC, partial [bacterium]|nr:rod shape-determining protein MreC [bacterium]